MFRRDLGGRVAALVVVAALVPASPAHALSRTALVQRLSSYSSKMGPASGAYVVDMTSGLELYSHRPDIRLAPASNEKLFTTSTALQTFGPPGILTTIVRQAADAVIDPNGVLHGDLYLIGGGDPSLNDIALHGMVTQLRVAAGIRSFTGSVIGDGSMFDARRGSSASGFAPDPDLGGYLGGLTWSHGRATPGGPANAAAARLQKLLRAAGVKGGRKARSGRIAEAPGGPGPILANIISPPMSTLIAVTNQPSDNFYAETLLKDLGARFGAAGTTAAGLAVVRSELKSIGIAPTMTDGSGLSHADRTSPREIVSLLRSMHAGTNASTFEGSLATPGRTGTLANRMRGTAAVGRCHAKTGTLNNVSALSGYCHTANGHVLAFSFIENFVNPVGAKRIEDKMVPALAAYSP